MRTVEYKDIVNWSPRHLTGTAIHYHKEYPLVRLGSVIVRSMDKVKIQPDEVYTRLTVRTNFGGIFRRDKKLGKDIGRKLQYRVKGNQLLVSKIDIGRGAVGIVPKELSRAVVTENFWVYDAVDRNKVMLEYLALVLSTTAFITLAAENSNGTTGRQYMQEKVFLDQYVPLPDIAIQHSLVRNFNRVMRRCSKIKAEIPQKERALYERLFEALGLSQTCEILTSGQLHLINSREMQDWSYDKLKSDTAWITPKYADLRIGEHPELFPIVQRGVSPQYTVTAGIGLLNQKCVRWFDLDLAHMKTVRTESLSKHPRELFTKRGDVLVNSTGDGTIGRSAVVRGQNESGRLYDSHVLLLRVNKDAVDPEYLCLLFNSDYVQSQINRLKSALATSQTELGVENLRKVRIILPPIEKQKSISKELNHYRAQIPKIDMVNNMLLKARKEFEHAIISDQYED